MPRGICRIYEGDKPVVSKKVPLQTLFVHYIKQTKRVEQI